MLQTDFGLEDGAVSSMYGVAYTVDPELGIHDLTHEIPAYDIKAAGYRLYQSLTYWPVGTVFVSVVDPGVGGNRRSVVCLTETGHYILTPDNGTLTYISQYVGIKEIRSINENVSRLAHSSESHTFHGRDIYVYNGARLASGQIKFENLGESFVNSEVVQLPVYPAENANKILRGTIDILDVRFGSLWTNIPLDFIKQIAVEYEDKLHVTIFHKKKQVYNEAIPFVKSFAEVDKLEPLVYINSLLNIAVALNQASFASIHQIGTGNEWTLELEKISE